LTFDPAAAPPPAAGALVAGAPPHAAMTTEAKSTSANSRLVRRKFLILMGSLLELQIANCKLQIAD
jgi:hypothetical protein